MPRRPLLSRLPLLAACLVLAGPLCAQPQTELPPATVTPVEPEQPVSVLEPFLATYEAHYQGKPAGSATMQLVRDGDSRWRIDLTIHGERGIAGLARLNLQQSTVFDTHDGHYRPLTQATARRAMFFGKEVTGIYDWSAMQAHWEGDLKKERRRPLPLQAGDMSALLINLAIMRDAAPGATLRYRMVDLGRAREYVYEAANEPEIMAVGDMSYDALRVARTSSDGDQTVLWVAGGVPTPIRILQRKDGEDEIDLRLVEYRGV
ncbi:DUF3108 domain-containing protein [Pseudoxanthomonas daejeonensis]|uniref:DUF3108 domain-containing protein n=1 Tax=Pseudoxanthomonas daejeonensis TaxID=266062 RepID=UPI001F542D63|nr:DUF3108 domain-containing protein [Pseudoxanthomonas daejeonensis]UNK56883.1 DUF3108 domain-containing protein [Pseudoxanthomonas daejeonensis]